MPNDQTKRLAAWLTRRWHSGRRLRDVTNGAAGCLVVASILSSFASSIIAAGGWKVPQVWAIVIAGLPGICLTIWRQFPFQSWASFQNMRYVLYREIYFMLEYGTIDLATAVEKVNAAGREIGRAADELPYVIFPSENKKPKFS